MVMSLNIIIRLKLANRPGTLARVLSVIAEEGGNLGAIDLVSASSSYMVRELMVRMHNRDHNDEMCLAAARALGEIVAEEQLSAENIIPSIFNKDVTPAVARAVAEAARRTGVARKYSYEERNRGGLLYTTINSE